MHNENTNTVETAEKISLTIDNINNINLLLCKVSITTTKMKNSTALHS